MNERTPLRKKPSGHFFVLTQYNPPEEEGGGGAGDAGGGGEADGTTSGGAVEEVTTKSERSGEEKRRKRKTARRPQAEQRVVPDPQLQTRINPVLCLVPRTARLVNAKLEEARRHAAVTTVMYAFTIVHGRLRHVQDCVLFESSAEYRRANEEDGAAPQPLPQAISDNQLAAEMHYCQAEYEVVAAIVLYLRTLPSGALHTLVMKQPYRVENRAATASLWDRLWQPAHLRGHYYKVVVDFMQTKYIALGM